MANRDDVLRDINDDLDDLEYKLSSMASILGKQLRNSLSDSSTEIIKLTEAVSNGENVTKDLVKQLLSAQKQSNRLSFDRKALNSDLAKALADNNLSDEKRIRKSILQNQLVSDQLDLTSKILKKLLEISKEDEIIASINKKRLAEENKILEEKKKQNSISEISRKIYKDTFKDILDSFTTLEGLIKIIIDASLLFNRISTDISKNFGYVTKESDRLTYDLLNAAQTSGNLNVTLKNLGESMSQLNEQTGLVAEYSAKTLETQIMLTKQFGLTKDEAAGIYKLSILNNISSDKTNKAMVSSYVAIRNQLGVGIPFRATMAEAAKVSGQLAANLKNNPELLIQAVSQAKALGITLEQTKKQGESLLEFESSIESELKAELLLGQALNLERARAAALMGDQVTVMKELNQQEMTLEKFQSLNVLAQKSFAAALGLSSDELANQLRQQKLAIESGKSLAQITEEEALEAQRRQTIQEKFNVAVEKLKDIIGNLLSGPFSELLDLLSNLLQIVGLIGKPFAVINKLIDSITKGARELGSVLKGILGIVAAIAVFRNPLLALSSLALVGGVIAGVDALIPEMAEGGVVPATPGGRIIRVAEAGQAEAIIPLNKLNNFGNSQQDNTALIAAINRQTEVIANKNYNPVLKTIISGTEIATTSAQSSYNVA